MSYKATGWAYDLPLRGSAKPVLVALADFADEAGSCYPGQERLAQMTGLNERTIRRALTRLETLGLIRRERRTDARGHRKSDRYYLAIGTQSLPDTEPTGQTAQWAESPSLPDTVAGTYRKNHQGEPSGGRQAPTPAQDQPQTNGAEPWCNRHPNGTDKPCAACKKARVAFEAAEAAPATPTPRYDPSVYCEHLGIIGKCDVCADEESRAMAILEEQFGRVQ